ncbi:hypothetical protein H4696_004777 [Amycolatopsis lexingtonensis]|uniref:Uncharacterized protein n=1 Tax=Amycolatopsis lexingtonensis TaxID=218822 RepID=A0ABR9I424_9PSEU|nr:hypothetical protein [Amycolatopsis lexingtonensis]MBE1497677.1 hypothetical protein [Amycolatopsis lexingtonensis]
MTGPESRRRGRTARPLGLLVPVALGYLGGVGVAAVFGLGDPWVRGLLGAALVLGAAAAASLRRRSRG